MALSDTAQAAEIRQTAAFSVETAAESARTASPSPNAVSGCEAAVTGPRIAVVCSGLGHIFRGVETWAYDLAHVLHQSGQNVTLFQGTGVSAHDWQKVLHCKPRTDPATERLGARLTRLGGWKYGVGSGYQLEQTTFAMKLWPQVRRGYDIVHTQDAWVGLHMERLHRRGLSRPRVILAHGTEEPTDYLQKFGVLQHLAPCYLEDWQPHRPIGQQAFAIGNFVKTELFHPASPDAQKQARQEWDLPSDALVVLSVAAIKKHHKRVDYLLREFAAFDAQWSQAGHQAILVIAGGREPETDEVMALGRNLLGSRVRFLTGVSRERMPSLYQTADIFALASLYEMMPIALLEALASGLPIACSDTPTLRWMTGPGGCPGEISEPGGLAAQLTRLLDAATRSRHAQQARQHAESTFSEAVIVRQILAMYNTVLGRH